jgi:hypothetical protein
VSCVDDWWDAQQVELPFDDEPEPDDGFCGEYLFPTWWRRKWPIYKETVHADVLPDISLWRPAA